MAKHNKLVIIGLGPAGLVAATQFASEGWDVTGLDRRHPPAPSPATDSRGYAFTFSPRGLSSLPQTIRHRVEPACHPLARRVFVYADGTRRAFPYGPFQQDKLYALPRREFQAQGIEAATEAGVSLVFNALVTEMDPLSGRVTTLKDGREECIAADLIIAADGAFSIARSRVAAIAGSSYSVHFDGVRYVTIQLTAEDVGRLTNDRLGIHFFMSTEGTDVFIPTGDAGTLIIMSPHIPGLGMLTHNSATTIAYSRNRIVQASLPDLLERLKGSIIGHFVSTEMTLPYAGRCVIVGDAWNAMPAYAGQGVNAAVQDIGHLVRSVKSSESLDLALQRFASARQRDRAQINRMNVEIGRQLLSGRYGNFQWRLKESISARLHRRSEYQRLAFDPEDATL